jgi:hypothetical protein
VRIGSSRKRRAANYFIRSHLESIATGLAAERITDAELAQLDLLMVEMRAAVDARDGPRFSDLHLEFHRTIVASCGNDMLRDLTMDIWQRHSGFQRVFRMVPGRLATSQREHEDVMAALRDHDAERASGSRCCTSGLCATPSARSSTRSTSAGRIQWATERSGSTGSRTGSTVAVRLRPPAGRRWASNQQPDEEDSGSAARGVGAPSAGVTGAVLPRLRTLTVFSPPEPWLPDTSVRRRLGDGVAGT